MSSSEPAGTDRPPRRRLAWTLFGLSLAGCVVLVAIAAAGVFWAQRNRAPPVTPPTPVAAVASVATYVGGTQCATCHAKETAAWKGSDHDLAM